MRLLGWALFQYEWCLSLQERRFAHPRARTGRRCEHTGRRGLSVHQGDQPQKEPTWPTPWSQIFSLQDCEKMSSCCLTQAGGRPHGSSNTQTTISLFPRGPFPEALTTLTAALGVQAEKLGQAALLHHGRAAQILLVKNPEEVIQLRQQLLQG